MARPKTAAVAITVVALILASLSAYMVYNYLAQKEREAEKAKLSVQPVVVAATDIPFGSSIQPAQVKTASWPINTVPAGSATDPKSVEGRLAVSNIAAGSPIIETALAPRQASGGVLSYIIPAGHRAITVAVNEVVGVAGFILPNSIVDVVATVNHPQRKEDARISKIILQNVKVLAIGQILEQKEGKPVLVPTVTLDVTPEDAERLAIASENRVQLILKHLGDSDSVRTSGQTVGSLLAGSGGAVPVKARLASGKGRGGARATKSVRVVQSGGNLYIIEVIKGGTRTTEKFRQ